MEKYRMKTVLICGSRNHHGQTAQACNALLDGLSKNNGFSVKQFFLPELKVERCRQCEENGWGMCRKEGYCIIADDFNDLVENIREANVVVFATPVYYSDLSESLRAFTDRLRRICTHNAGRLGVEEKNAIGICVAGGGGGGAPACCVSLEKVMNDCGFKVIDLIPVRRQNLQIKLETFETIGQLLGTEY
jgi:multimeric flavodoxin WrbA